MNTSAARVDYLLTELPEDPSPLLAGDTPIKRAIEVFEAWYGVPGCEVNVKRELPELLS
jgi:hypothetical protein